MNIDHMNGWKENINNALNIIGWIDTNSSTDNGSNENFNNITLKLINHSLSNFKANNNTDIIKATIRTIICGWIGINLSNNI